MIQLFCVLSEYSVTVKRKKKNLDQVLHSGADGVIVPSFLRSSVMKPLWLDDWLEKRSCLSII